MGCPSTDGPRKELRPYNKLYKYNRVWHGSGNAVGRVQVAVASSQLDDDKDALVDGKAYRFRRL